MEEMYSLNLISTNTNVTTDLKISKFIRHILNNKGLRMVRSPQTAYQFIVFGCEICFKMNKTTSVIKACFFFETLSLDLIPFSKGNWENQCYLEQHHLDSWDFVFMTFSVKNPVKVIFLISRLSGQWDVSHYWSTFHSNQYH